VLSTDSERQPKRDPNTKPEDYWPTGLTLLLGLIGVEVALHSEDLNKLPPLLHSKAEAVHLLRVSLRTIDNLVLRKKLKPTRVGNRVLFQRKELERFASVGHYDMAEAA